MKLAYAYGRGSTDPQVITLEEQEHQARRYFDYRLGPAGFTWAGMYVDQGISGSYPFSEREAGGILDERLGEGDALILTKLDRGFRSMADCATKIDDWHLRRITLHILDINVDTTTPTGVFFVHIMAAFAQMERSRMSERMRDMHACLKRKGLFEGGPRAPVGHKLVDGPQIVTKKNGHVGPEKLVVPDPAERAIMAYLVELHDDDGWSFTEIAAQMNFLDDPVTTPRQRLSAAEYRKTRRKWSGTKVYHYYNRELELRAEEEAEKSPEPAAPSAD